ncbi:MAG: Hsp20/alpha crystallin family protein [Crocinitomicaceae bacterium]|jgi:HSP20 family protein|nr:Hsp20/alpha crystallin family protein [Crocinitomicaceae bacterium]
MSTLVKRNPTFPTVNSFFNDFFGNDFFDWNTPAFSPKGSTLPSVNLKETETGYEVELAAPGLNKEDFVIEVHNNVLSISSEKKVEKEEKDEQGNYTRREFNYSSFKRSFTLPKSAEEKNVQAVYDNGILKVSIAKKETEKEKIPTKIEVQ